MGIGHLRRVDDRLHRLLWHFAFRWGHVDREGVVVPIHFTHQMLAKLVGAERPSVTRALGHLSETGLVTRRQDGSWLLLGEPPEQVPDERRDPLHVHGLIRSRAVCA